jgi:hypothetical protein
MGGGGGLGNKDAKSSRNSFRNMGFNIPPDPVQPAAATPASPVSSIPANDSAKVAKAQLLASGQQSTILTGSLGNPVTGKRTLLGA